MEEKTKREETTEEALSDDELDMVVGGTELRRTKKVETVDISEDTKSKV